MTPKPKTPGGKKPGGGSPDGGSGKKRPSAKVGKVDASTVSEGIDTTGEFARAGRSGQGTGQPGTPTTVDPNVRGPAGKVELRPPHDRHQLNRIKPGSHPKADNTVILPEARDGFRQDLADIQAGKAQWDPGSNSYVTSTGRRYKVESNGTVFPVDGPGFVKLNRAEYKALQALIQHNGDVDAAKASVARDPGIPPEAFDKAGQVHQHYGK